jgi:hypothetical protein
VVTDGQRVNQSIPGIYPLPDSLLARARERIQLIGYQGERLYEVWAGQP